MTNVEKWFTYENSKNLEEQAKYFIATSIEGGLNGYRDYSRELGVDEDQKMTKEEWVQYAWDTIEYEKGIYTNGKESQHIKFVSKAKFEKLAREYVDNYKELQPYIKA